MARMFPPVFPTSGPSEASSERLAYERLAALPDDVDVFYEPRVPAPRGSGPAALRPDFVVSLPDRILVNVPLPRLLRVFRDRIREVLDRHARVILADMMRGAN